MNKRFVHTLYIAVLLALLSSITACASQEQSLNFQTVTPITFTSTPRLFSITATPQPKFSPTATSTSAPPMIASYYRLPNWFRNSESTILMMITDVSDIANQVSFLNANSQERFDISMPTTETSHYFWTIDGKSFGFLSRDLTSVYLVNTLTGFVTKYPIRGKAADCLQDYHESHGPINSLILEKIWVYDVSPENDDFFCEPGDIEKKTTVPSYSDDYSSPIEWSWSRDNSQFLVRTNSPDKQGLPCIINKFGKKVKCLTAIDSKYYERGLDIFRWSWDDSHIYYTQSDDLRTDLCIYNLFSDMIYCPSQNIQELNKLNIEWYDISSDEQFFILSYGSSCNGCDFWGDPSSLVVRRDGTDVYFLGKEVNTFVHYPFNSILIRPNGW